MPEVEDANQRFNQLWDEIGAKRITIGDEEKGVEIVVDADLSIFGILEKLKDTARAGHDEGEISDDEQKMIATTLEDCARAFSGGIHDRLRRQVDKLTGKDH
jgi:hypothetical protein